MSDALSLILGAIERLEAGQSKLQAGLTEVRNGLTDVHTRQVELSDELGHVRGAVMARIDRLQDALNQQRDDALVTYSRIDRLEKPMREKIENIEREISAMYIQIRNLQTDVRLIRGDH